MLSKVVILNKLCVIPAEPGLSQGFCCRFINKRCGTIDKIFPFVWQILAANIPHWYRYSCCAGAFLRAECVV